MKSAVVGMFSLSLLVLLTWRSSSTCHQPLTPSAAAPQEAKHGEHPSLDRPTPSRAIPAAPHNQIHIENKLALIETETDEELRSERLDQAVASVAVTDLPATLDSLQNDTRSVAIELSHLLLRRWAESEPSRAAEWAARLPDGEDRRSTLERVAVVWAESDVDAATAWVRSLPAGEDRNSASLSLAYEAARTNPLMALELASVLQPTRERDDLIAHAVSQWTANDSLAATAWVTMVPDPVLRPRLLASVAINNAEQDGAIAANLVAQALNGTNERDRAVIAVVQRWSQASPSETAVWISQFPESAVRNAATRTLIDVWATHDPQNSGLWVRDLPNGALRDIALEAYVQALANDDAGLESASNSQEGVR